MTNSLRLDFASFCARSGVDHSALTEVINPLLDFKGKAWVAGGAVRRTISNKPLDSDFDFFFKDKGSLDAYTEKMGEPYRETNHHKHWKYKPKDSDIQGIHFQFYETAEAVIDSFDYTITQFAIDGSDLVTTPFALWDLGRKKLAIHKVTYPVATMRRLLKYGRQGFTACSGCMATLLRETASNPDALAALDIEYVD